MTATIERWASPTGKPRYRTVEDGKTYEAHVGAQGRLLFIRGAMENKKPLEATYDLQNADVERWPDFFGRTAGARTRRDRFNAAAWRLIEAANEDWEKQSHG